MSISICIQCGYLKKARPIAPCARCGFTPASSEDKAKSIILSTYYDDLGDEHLGLGKSREELLAIAPTVAAGDYHFDLDEVTALARRGEEVMATPGRVLLLDGAKAFGPALLLLAGLLAVIWFAR